MDVDHLLDQLGGNKSVADSLGIRATAVGMWRQRGEVPARFHLAVWRLALAAGLDWEPPGAAELRPLLAAQLCPASESPTSKEAA